MTTTINYRRMFPGEETQVCDLVRRVFHEHVAPLYSRDGIDEFERFVNPQAITEQLKTDGFIILALSDESPVGVVYIKKQSHLSLFFVETELQGQGIGREILKLAMDAVLTNQPQADRLTVNSSPNAVNIYEKLGFKATADQQTVNGIIFTPMTRPLGHDS